LSHYRHSKSCRSVGLAGFNNYCCSFCGTQSSPRLIRRRMVACCQAGLDNHLTISLVIPSLLLIMMVRRSATKCSCPSITKARIVLISSRVYFSHHFEGWSVHLLDITPPKESALHVLLRTVHAAITTVTTHVIAVKSNRTEQSMGWVPTAYSMIGSRR
jgi:hypothetical protein